MKKTPMNHAHHQLKAKMTDFGGWEMPVQYESIIKEHQAVREDCGMFDVSHMGEMEITGKQALEFVSFLVTNEIKNQPGKVFYSPMCNEKGGCIDDLLIYVFNQEKCLLVVNASNIGSDLEWILQQSRAFEVEIKDVSDQYALIALQGPNVEKKLQGFTTEKLADLSFFAFKEEILIHDIPVCISRTGYTGEDGFELYFDAKNGEALFVKLKDEGFTPCGLGARDTLRLESGLPLYGHELDNQKTPVEAGLKFFVKQEKQSFIAKEVLIQQLKEGTKKQLVGFEMIERGIPRQGYAVYANEELVGEVTSGSFCPTLQKNMGLAYVQTEYAKIDTQLTIEIRNKKVLAKVVKKPFYRKKYKK